MLKRFLSYYKPQMGLFVADTVCALVLAAIDLAFPIILRNLTGGLFTQGQAAIMQALGMIAVGLVLMYAVRCACRYFVSYWGHVMGARMESKMREDLFDQYERFSFAYFDRNSSGDMMSRVVNDLFDICEAAHHVPEWIIICGIEIIGSFAILFTIAPVLALAMAVVTAAFAVIMFWQNMRMREVFSDNRKKISGINAQLQDSLAGMRVVKSFANEETERAKFRASNDRYLSSKENMYHAMGVYTATYGLLSGVLYMIVVLLGEAGKQYVPYLITVALYIACSNLIGIIGLKPPTKDLNVTAALAIMSIVLIEYSGIHAKGGKRFVHSLAEPIALMTPMNILEIAIRPTSLCMRLFGNVLGAFVIMELIKLVVPVFVPAIFSLYFDLFDGLIQTYVFVFLTSLFMKETME